MNKKSYFFLLVILTVMFLTQIYQLYRSIYFITDFWYVSINNPDEMGYVVTGYFVNAIYYLGILVLIAFAIIYILKKISFFALIKESRENHKIKQTQKKTEKKARKTEKLEKQLNALKKDTE